MSVWRATMGAATAVVLGVGLIAAAPTVVATQPSSLPEKAPSSTPRASAPIWQPRRVLLASYVLPARAAHAVSLGPLIAGSATRAVQARAQVTTGPTTRTGAIRIETSPNRSYRHVNRAGTQARATARLTVPRSGTWVVRNLRRFAIPINIFGLGYWRVAPGTSPPAPQPGPGPQPDPGPPPEPMPVSGDGRLDISGANYTDVWVDPVAGSDSNSGSSRGSALRTITAAWNRIPANQALASGRRIQLVAGTYGSSLSPNYWENRRGTATNPIILNAADGAHTATMTGDINMFNTSHFYLVGVDIRRDGDAFHCEQCSNVLIRNSTMNGNVNPGGAEAHETIKVNQSTNLYIEDSTITGADDNAIDFVAVQYGHLLGNNVTRAGDWCGYVKGGSAHILVAENTFAHCGTGGFTAGQGTGIEFMTAPWINYEAVGIRIVNNIIHDTQGAGLGVNGGYNILLAYNTMYRVGSRSHGVEFVYGLRSCDAAHAGASVSGCTARVNAGGWGTATTADTYIGNKHVYFYNNVLYNPSPFASAWEHIAVYGPRTNQSSPAPSPARTDTDLRIAGNVFWNGPSGLPTGAGNGCATGNPTCTDALIRANNAVNIWQPSLTNPAGADFRPLANSQLANASAVPIPSFGWSDVPVGGMGESWTDNSVPKNRSGDARTGWGRPGAY